MPRRGQDGGDRQTAPEHSITEGVSFTYDRAPGIERARRTDQRHFAKYPRQTSYIRPFIPGEVAPHLVEGREPPAYVAVARVCRVLLVRSERCLGFPVAEARAEAEQLAQSYGRGCAVASPCKPGRCRLLNQAR